MRTSLLILALACVAGCGRTGIGDLGEFGVGTGTPDTTTTTDGGSETGPADSSGLPDIPPGTTTTTGDGDGDPATGDGDGDMTTTTTGDGDGDMTTTTTSGDGDMTTTGDGDGDEPGCGNGIVDVGEQCDGLDLNGFDCISLGYDAGELACDPILCVYDASACQISMDTGGTTG